MCLAMLSPVSSHILVVDLPVNWRRRSTKGSDLTRGFTWNGVLQTSTTAGTSHDTHAEMVSRVVICRQARRPCTLGPHVTLILRAREPFFHENSAEARISPLPVASTTRATKVKSCDKKASPRSVVTAATAVISSDFLDTSEA